VSWAAATDPTIKAAYYAAAQQAVMMTEFAFPFSFCGSFAGIAAIAAVMRKRWKWTGWFGLVMGVLCSVSSALFLIPATSFMGFFVQFGIFFLFIFATATGIRLFRLGMKNT
jgi:ABC-type proline/glycine betaine transport system permease subunit